MTLVVFDFDGVLLDTARECLEVSYQTVRAQTSLAFGDRWRDQPEPSAELAATFAKHRYLVGPPWQYAVLLECIAAGDVPSETRVFLELCAAKKASLEGFTDAYFGERAKLAASPRWVTLATPYAPSAAVFRELHARGDAAILSTRDDRSIQLLLAHHVGVADPHMLPRAGTREKWELLLDTAADRKLAPEQLFFVDDYVQHALPARRRGIAAHLATWGYLGPHDIREATAAALPCLQLADLATAVRAHQDKP
jgi:phosphoglycolate phosphatase-like HAD superfamily hydrolase